jgi:hypothetical protein
MRRNRTRARALMRLRKTGITLPDTGVRDEHGMEPLDNMFSSPRKANGDDDEYSSDEQSMDIDNSQESFDQHLRQGGLALLTT